MNLAESNGSAADPATEILRTQVLERVQAVETLRETGMKYRTIIEQIDEGFILVDGQGQVTEWNLAMEHLSGLPKVRVLGNFFWVIMSQICVEKTDTSAKRDSLRDQLHEALRETLLSGRTAPLNATLPSVMFKPSGSRIACRMMAFPVGMDAGWFAAVVVNQR